MWVLLALLLQAPPDGGAAGAVYAGGGYQLDLPLAPTAVDPAGRSGVGLRRDPAGGAGGASRHGESGPAEQAPDASEPVADPPGTSAPTPPPTTAPPATQPPRTQPPPPPRATDPVPHVSTASASLLGWIVFALILAVALFVALRSRGASEAEGAPVTPTVSPRRSATVLPDPQALAAAGHYAEAIHALLLVALADLARRAKQRAHEGLTGRELVSAAAPRAVQSAFAPLLEAVERTHFGGEPASSDDFARCAAQARAVQAAWRG